MKKTKSLKIATILLVSLLLLTGFPGIIKNQKYEADALGSYFVIAGTVSAMVPIAVCNSPAAAGCTMCAGPFNQLIFSLNFGMNLNSLYYFCQSPSVLARGNAPMFQIGSNCLGVTPADRCVTNDGVACNISCSIQY